MPIASQAVSRVTTVRNYLASISKKFIVTNPTPGTAIAYASQTGFSATANGLFLVQNTNPSGGANIVLDRLMLHQTATAPTGTLYMRFEVYGETGLVKMTGNVATRTPVCLNSATPTAQTGAFVQSFAAGAATVPAAAGTRGLLGIGSIPTGVTVLGDTYFVDFGTDGPAASIGGLTAARATDLAARGTQMNPVVIGPQSTAWINMWWVTQATNIPSFEFALTFDEI